MTTTHDAIIRGGASPTPTALTDEMREALNTEMRAHLASAYGFDPRLANAFDALLAREAALVKERDELAAAWVRMGKESEAAEALAADLHLQLDEAVEALRPFAHVGAVLEMDPDGDPWGKKLDALRRAVHRNAFERAAQLVADAPVAGEDDTVLRSGGGS